MGLVLCLLLAGCSARSPSEQVALTFPGSTLGTEAEILSRQLDRFMRLHPAVRVVRQSVPDAADQRHQLYVQWLNARAGDPDILQLDVVWTPEFSAAGWLLPLGESLDQLDESSLDQDAFVPAALEASSYAGRLYALPWFVDVGMLYYRTDLVEHPPQTFDELALLARAATKKAELPFGMVWQAARYEGLVTVFLEILGGHGGSLDVSKPALGLDSEAARAALEYMTRATGADGFVPREALAWQEEQTRFAFQNGRAVFMRNWPYAYALLQAPDSAVAGRVGIAPMPAARGGHETAALGGSSLAINANTEHPREALQLIDFLTRPEQMLERAAVTGQLPARRELYDSPELAEHLPLPAADVRAVVERATARPSSPFYTELSSVLQLHLHRALAGQATPEQAIRQASLELEQVRSERGASTSREPRSWGWIPFGLALLGALAYLARRARRRSRHMDRRFERAEVRSAWLFVAPALLVIAGVALFPLGWTLLESFHEHDLRTPFRGRRFVGLENYSELFASPRFAATLLRTLFFTLTSVALELLLGLAIALFLNRRVRLGGVARASALLPWAVPTVVAALVFRFLFDGRQALASALLAPLGEAPSFLSHELWVWLPVILSDVWKTAPFVGLLLLAGLKTIDPKLYEAARVDGAFKLEELLFITLPLLRPAIVVALVFRTLDAVRVFDLVYVLTGGGPGNASEPLALLAFHTLFQNLRFGHGAALGVLIFLLAFGLALGMLALWGRDLVTKER